MQHAFELVCLAHQEIGSDGLIPAVVTWTCLLEPAAGFPYSCQAPFVPKVPHWPGMEDGARPLGAKHHADRDKNVTRLMRLALLALVTTVPMMPAASLASQPSQGSEAATPTDLAEAMSAYRQATMQSDIATLSNLVADDYILINSDSSLQAKPSYLADFKLPGFKIDRYVVEQPVYKVWGDTALVRSMLHLGWTQDGRQHSRVLRIAHVWTRRDGHWQIEYTQLTRVPDR